VIGKTAEPPLVILAFADGTRGDLERRERRDEPGVELDGRVLSGELVDLRERRGCVRGGLRGGSRVVLTTSGGAEDQKC